MYELPGLLAKAQHFVRVSLGAFNTQRFPLKKSCRKLQLGDLSYSRAVCAQVLGDPGVPERELKARAKALKKLGSIFQVQPGNACMRQQIMWQDETHSDD